MGCLFVLLLGGISAALIFFSGYTLWGLVVLGSLWLAALGVAAVAGHQGFGGGNTDVLIVIAGLAIAGIIIIPRYAATTPCGQAKATLTRLVEAENECYSQHKTFASDLTLLSMKPSPHVHIILLRGDQQSFAASVSHSLCVKDKTGAPQVFMWDSATRPL